MIKKPFRQVLNLLKFNISTMVKFELIYKLLSTLVFIPLAVLILDFSMKITGYSYLTIENIGSYISNPKNIIIFIILILLLTFFSMIDISAVIYIIDSSKHEKHVTLRQVITFAWENSKRVFHRKNFFIALFVLLILPVMNIGMTSGLITYIAIPEFIMDFINANMLLSIAWMLLMVALQFLQYADFIVFITLPLKDVLLLRQRSEVVNFIMGIGFMIFWLWLFCK